MEDIEDMFKNDDTVTSQRPPIKKKVVRSLPVQ